MAGWSGAVAARQWVQLGAFAVLLFLQAEDLDDEGVCWWLGTNCVIIMILRLIYGG